MKNKKGNVAIIAIIIAIVAINAGVIGWLLASRNQVPVQQMAATQPGQVAQNSTLPTVQTQSSAAGSNDNQKAENIAACDEKTICGKPCLYNGVIYTTKMFTNLCWMTKNINTTTKADGSTTVKKYCYGDDPNNCETYGGLYLWADAMALPEKCNTIRCDSVNNAQGICPNGWHVSTNNEWDRLAGSFSYERLVNNEEVAFGKVLAGERHYEGPDTSDSSSTWVGSFFYIDYSGNYWTPVQTGSNGAVSWNINSYDATVQRSYMTINKGVGFSVRCIKNEEGMDYDADLNSRDDVSCTDSDNGKNYYKKGVAKGIYDNSYNITGNGSVFGDGAKYPHDSGEKRTIYTDYCEGNTWLSESYCEDGKLLATGFECPNGCKNGACRK